jgi:hypothetical protein
VRERPVARTEPAARPRLSVPWWWIAILIAGMAIAFALGAML